MLFIFLILLINIFGNLTAYFSQVGQDKFLNENYFHNKKNGIFIDIGAHDGISFSNSYFFEKNLNWTGICIEPMVNFYNQLVKNRKAININCCLSINEGIVKFIEVSGPLNMLSGMLHTYHPKHWTRLLNELKISGGSYKIIDIPSRTLSSILNESNILKIDYLSIDTEGGELEILKNLDLKKIYIYAISIENNYNEPNIKQYLESNGFVYVKSLSSDEIYINKN